MFTQCWKSIVSNAFFFWKARPSGPQTLALMNKEAAIHIVSTVSSWPHDEKSQGIDSKVERKVNQDLWNVACKSGIHFSSPFFTELHNFANIMKHFPDCTNRLCWCAKWTIPTHSHFSAPKFMIYSSQGTRRAALHPGCGAMAQCLTGYMGLTFQAKTHLRKLRWQWKIQPSFTGNTRYLFKWLFFPMSCWFAGEHPIESCIMSVVRTIFWTFFLEVRSIWGLSLKTYDNIGWAKVYTPLLDSTLKKKKQLPFLKHHVGYST